jgi:siroheme synthase-like protein
MNEYLPIGLSLKRRKCLVVGGGRVALRKVNGLLEFESTITVIAPEVVEKLEYYAERKKITLMKRPYQSGDVKGFGLVIAAVDNPVVSRQIHEESLAAGIPVNVVDQPELCDVIMPAVTKRGPLTVAVSTDGRAPYLSGYLRLVMDDIFPERWSRIAKYAAQFREMVHRDGPKEQENRQKCYGLFLNADWQEILKENPEDQQIHEILRDWLRVD